MTRQFSTVRPSAFILRLATSGLLMMQTAIATTIISEFTLTTPGTLLTQSASAQTRGRSNVQDAEAAVVYIETDQGRSGSGVVIDSNGLIVTNAHVVEGARRVVVTVQGRQVEAEVVSRGSSNCLDLALLQLPGQRNLPTLSFASSDDIYKTQPVWALGFPVGSTPTSASIVQGSISNIRPASGDIVFDAPVNRGNSGGPVVDNRSRLVGITTAGATNNQNINYAISVDQVRMFVDAYRHGMGFSIGQYLIPAVASAAQPIGQALTLARGTVEGSLQSGDSRLCGDNSAADVYTFEARAGQSVMLEMMSSDVGSYLMLIAPNGQLIARTGSNGVNRKALLLQKLGQTGTYVLLANAERPEQSGGYDLRISRPLLVEQGRLDASSAPCFSNGARCQQYGFQGQAGQTVTMWAQSAFDSYLIVQDAKGETVVEGQADREGNVTFQLPTDGWYSLIVAGVHAEAEGSFVVSIMDDQDMPRSTSVSQRP